MTHINPKNERTKRAYFRFLREAKGHSEPTIDLVAKALARFDAFNRQRDYQLFRVEQAVAFKQNLAQQLGARSGQHLSKATMRQTLTALKSFFEWLSGQPGFRSRITYLNAAYFNPSLKDDEVARARREPRYPSLEQMHHVLACMPKSTEVQRRNRALVAYALLTAARADAIASVRMKHVDMVGGCVFQDARQVRTKFSTSMTVQFFPVAGNARQILDEWVTYLAQEKLWGPDDPLFPATEVRPGPNHNFEATGLSRDCWKGSSAVRAIFKDAFAGAGLPYFHPHSLRHTIAHLGEKLCKTPEALKAWSQNMGHKQVLTSLINYGHVATDRQCEIIRDFEEGREVLPQSDIFAMEVVELARKHALLSQKGGSL